MKYRTIVADPPWRYDDGFIGTNANGTGKTVRRPLPYPSMTVEEIAALNVRVLSEAAGANVFLWTTNRYIGDAFRVLQSWGCIYRQTLVWHKTPRPLTGGIAPTSLEFLLFARIHGGAPIQGRLDDALVSTKRLANSHSHKPELFLDMVERVSPGPYLELFARRNRLGWDTWGNEALEHVDLVKEGP